MKSKSFIKFGGITLAFVLLIIGYIFFSERSLLASGESRAQNIAQALEDGDIEFVKSELAEFVGTDDASRDSEYQKALASIDYVSSVIGTDGELRFVGGELTEGNESTNFGAAFALPAPQGGEDFWLVTLSREENTWQLANTQLSATNPFLEEAAD